MTKRKKEKLIESAERKILIQQERRNAKKRRRMPVHGAGLKKIGNIWQKRLRGQ